MSGPKDHEEDDHAQTEVLNDLEQMPDFDPDATAILGEEYRREVEGGGKPPGST